MPLHYEPQKRRAAALIVVVTFVVLLSAMVVAFFSRVGTSLGESRTYAESVSVRQLADSAVGVVMGQIREATTVKNGAWESQPGMIRVYRSPNGQPGPDVHAFYKLYSSPDLIVSREEADGFAIGDYEASSGLAEVPLGSGGWRDQPAFFTDLNESTVVPVTDRNGRQTGRTAKRYPIFDPSVAALRDPSVKDPKKVERPAKIEGIEIEIPAKLRDEQTEAPMPVRWIYVLRDGTLTAPTPLRGAATGNTGSMAGWEPLSASGYKTGVPTKSNPIVGRIAFWADDDTSKVNINTAGGFIPPPGKDEDEDLDAAMAYAGSFWDTPRMQTHFDRGTHDSTGQLKKGGLSNAQPGQNEFQRYPGHPATTSLGLVFKKLIPRGSGFDSEKLYAWSPRLTPGGSLGGTFRLDTVVDREMPIKSALEPDAEGRTFHLFASPDEMLYSSLNGERQLAEKALSLSPGTVSPDIFDQARFVLTAHSRAPELNLFGRPRVTIWPVWHEQPGVDPRESRNNPSDHLIRFCSTIGRREFLFARERAYSSTHDFALPRNKSVFNYLRELTSKTKGRIPGFGGSFEEKLASAPGGRDQVLTAIFDYIRTVNLKDTTRFRDINSGTSTEQQAERERFMYAPRGIVAPTRARVDGTPVSGFGRFPTISEASMVFYFAGAVVKDRRNPLGDDIHIYDGSVLSAKGFTDRYTVVANLMRAFLVLETFNPMQGYAPVNRLDRDHEVLVHEITFDSGFAISSASAPKPQGLGFKKGANRVSWSSGDTWGGRNFGGTEGFLHTMMGDKKIEIYNSGNDDPSDPLPKCGYPFYSAMPGVRIPAADKTFNFSGGKLTLKIKLNSETLQTIRLDFPAAGGWPMPTPQVWRDAGGFDKSVSGANPKSQRHWASFFERRLSWVAMSNNGTKSLESDHSYNPWEPHNNGDGLNYHNRWRNLLQPGDTIRSLIPGRSDRPDQTDPRLIALLSEPGSLFLPHSDYTSAKPRATTLRRADGAFYLGGADDTDARVTVRPTNQALNGSLIELPPARVYGGNKGPDLQPGVVARRSDGRAADFDTGIGNYPDGAFAGKADEGNVVWRSFDNNTGRWNFVEPYFSTAAYDSPMDTFFSPNRQLPSAVMFGSLLSRRSGWETLLFCPNPAGDSHPGARSPRDHLLLDLFTMPVVEPYAISEPFSTAGKVNLNYAIAPFGYLKRTTALRAALHPLRVTALPQTAVDRYKSKDNPENYRYLVDRDETIRGFDDFFAAYKNDRSKGFFKSASEICERYLYPKGRTHAGTVSYRGRSETDIRQQFWKESALTGDNVREKPYADLYPRITTKSNTYTVHYRVQTLRQRAYTGPAGGEEAYYRTWDESRDQVLAEYRGHTTIERYLDPEDERFKVNYAKGDRIDVERESLEDAYRFRVIYHKRFSPW
jgi:uncharacterized protein (TIGR02600 family)